MELGARVDVLRDSPVWSGHGDEELAAVATAMEPRAYPSGSAVVRQGQADHGLQVIVAGSAEARVRGENGHWVPVARFGPGDCFGEMSLLTGEGATADVVALSPLSTLELSRPVFDALLAERPIVVRAFLGLLSRRLTATNLSVCDATERADELAMFLREQEGDGSLELVGKERQNKDLEKAVARAAACDEPRVLVGERGVGKELAARLIHYASRRCAAPLLRVQCERLTATDWGDPLFGAAGGGGKPVSYFDLAKGGTILLHHLEALPRVLQDRLADYLSRPAAESDVRIVATCCHDPAEEVAAGRLSPRLGEQLLGYAIRIAPLRDRKRDIADLAHHFLARHAARQGKSITGLDDQAVVKLLNYDYGYANVRELEEAVERAVTLSNGVTIGPDEIFLGAPSRSRSAAPNLLRLPAPLVRIGLAIFPRLARGVVATFFFATLLCCLFGKPETTGRIGLVLAWCLWWPSLFFSFALLGRGWCAVCPMATTAGLAQRWVSLDRKLPGWIKDHEVPFLVTGFVLIVWVEESTGMRWHPQATGLLLLTILSLAVACGIAFPRRTWCRHFCPLGGLASVCSTYSILELRPEPDICAAKCKGHLCYKGNEQVPGCPMFQHVMFLDTNQHCVLCLNCVRSCPNGSPRLNLRFPGQELWQHETGRPEAGIFAAMLGGLLPAVALLQHWDDGGGAWLGEWVRLHRVVGVSILLALGAGTPLAGLALLTGLGRRRLVSIDPTAMHRRALAWLPLIGAGWTAYQLRFVPLLGEIRTEFVYLAGQSQPHLHFSLLAALEIVMLAAGLIITATVHWKLPEAQSSGRPPQHHRLWHILAAVTYWGVLLILMLRPDWFVP